MRSAPVGHDLPMLGAFLLAVAVVIAVGGAVTAAAMPEWYGTLVKPSWTLTNWVFGPAWTTLYILMALAAWLVWRRRRSAPVRGALIAWWTQLGLNLLWTLVFFGGRAPTWALVEIALLWFAIALTLALFWRVRPIAGVLMVPYLGWVGFAASLNAGIVALN